MIEKGHKILHSTMIDELTQISEYGEEKDDSVESIQDLEKHNTLDCQDVSN